MSQDRGSYKYKCTVCPPHPRTQRCTRKLVGCCQLLRRKWNQIVQWYRNEQNSWLRQAERKTFDILLLCQSKDFSPSREGNWVFPSGRYPCSAFQGVKQETKAWGFLLVEVVHSSVYCNAFLFISSSNECNLLVPKGCPWYLIFLGKKGTALLRAACIILCHWWVWSFRSVQSPVFKP